MISILSFFYPLCFGWERGQSYRTEFAKMNIHCLFHKNWHMALCLLCINKNVVMPVSLLEFFLFQILLKSFTVFSFFSQGCVLDVFCFLCQFSTFHNFCFRTIAVPFFFPLVGMLLFSFLIAVSSATEPAQTAASWNTDIYTKAEASQSSAKPADSGFLHHRGPLSFIPY